MDIAETQINIGTQISKLLEIREVKENRWSFDFLNSVLSQHKRGKTLSEKQIALVEKIGGEYDSKVLEVKRKEIEDFSKEYIEGGKKFLAKKIANHYFETYKQTGAYYYQKICEKILSDENYVPSGKDYRKLVENKWSQRFLEIINTECSFKLGDLCVNRKKKGHLIDEQILLVLKIDPPVRAVVGAYNITVMPVGGGTNYKILEKDLKLVRK